MWLVGYSDQEARKPEVHFENREVPIGTEGEWSNSADDLFRRFREPGCSVYSSSLTARGRRTGLQSTMRSTCCGDAKDLCKPDEAVERP